METEGRVCGRGEGVKRGAGPGREAGFRGTGAARGAPAPVHCALCGAGGGWGGGEGASPGGGGGAVGVCRGGGAWLTPPRGVPARALGDAEHRRDNLVAGEGTPARTEGGQPPRQPRRLTAAGPALPAMSLPAAAPTPSRSVSGVASDSAPWRLERGSRSNAGEKGRGAWPGARPISAQGLRPQPLRFSNVVSNTWGRRKRGAGGEGGAGGREGGGEGAGAREGEEN